MNLTEIRELFRYNSWAHRRMFDIVAQVPHNLYMQSAGTSHGSLHGTVTHTIGAEGLWLLRWNGHSPTALPSPADFPDFAAVRSRWEETDRDLQAFCIALATEESLGRVIRYTDLKGNQHSEQLHRLMKHLVNHSSYHRGQIAMFLRQYGCIPASTDLLIYFREHPAPAY